MRLVLYTLFFLSGAASLGYQLVWTRLFTSGLGHEGPALLAVLAAFMTGLALGAWQLDGPIARTTNPARWYAALEAIIGLWALVLVWLIPRANPVVANLIGLTPSPARHWTLAFLAPCLMLLPATTAMGATFPAMVRLMAGERKIGGLYAANTFGAVAGTLAVAFVIIPGVGFSRTCVVMAGLNVLCAAGAMWWWGRRRTEAPGHTATPPASKAEDGAKALVRLVISGLLGIGYETLAVRVLSQVLDNTFCSYAAVLAVFLTGTAIGAAVYQRFNRGLNSASVLNGLVFGLAGACLVEMLVAHGALGMQELLRLWLGDLPGAVLVTELLLAAALLLLPTLLMGALFSHLVELACKSGTSGRAVAANTLGAALAPVCFGVVWLPLVGWKWTFVGISLGYAVLATGSMKWRAMVLGTILLVAALTPRELAFLKLAQGERVLASRLGALGAVAVTTDATGHKTLRVDNRFQMGGTGSTVAEYRQAGIPLLLHPAPRAALFLGAGTGITAGAATLHPGLQTEQVELVPEVVALHQWFRPENAPGPGGAPLTHIADARRFIRGTKRTYDVIVGDLFHPARDGAGLLYTREHFTAIRERLTTNGVFCQWLPLHQLDLETLRSITRTFLEIFPDAQAWLLRFNVDAPVVGLISGINLATNSSDRVDVLIGDADKTLGEHLRQIGLGSAVRVYGCILSGADGLKLWTANAPINTDDFPQVSFRVPRASPRAETRPHTRLLMLLSELSNASAAIGRELPESVAEQVGRFIRARDAFLRGLGADAEGRSEAALGMYLESAGLSAEFTAGYAQCLTQASLLAKDNPNGAESLLIRLIEAQPAIPVARQMLDKLRERKNR